MEFRDITQQIAEVATRYHYQNPPTFLVHIQEMVARILRAVKDWLESLHILSPGMSDTRMVGNVMQMILYGVGILCAIALIFVVWSRLTKLTAQSKLARAGALSSEGSLDADGWLDEAEKLANQSRYRESCRAIYFSFLRLLDEKSVYPFQPTRTNYEYWYGLVSHKKIQRLFREVADTVELVWFGNKEADASDFNHCLKIVSEARKEVEAVVAEQAAQAVAAGRSEV